MSDTANMFLIYPGMTDFEEVEIIEPSVPHGYVWVRPLGSDATFDVHTSRLVDRATAMSRKNTTIIERNGYTVSETTIRGI